MDERSVKSERGVGGDVSRESSIRSGRNEDDEDGAEVKGPEARACCLESLIGFSLLFRFLSCG